MENKYASKYSGNQLGKPTMTPTRYTDASRYFTQRHSNKYGNSSFWMDDIVDRTHEGGSGFDILKMVKYQRAIANFVKIVGRKDIPVVFNSKDHSYTDGKTKVVISADVNDKSFDVTAGLALHEASHILLTDFNIGERYFSIYGSRSLQGINAWYSSHQGCPTGKCIENSMPYLKSKNFDSPAAKKITVAALFQILNWVEDRRIDNEIFHMAPGYKNYYHSLYEKYFLNKDIGIALTSKEYRTEDLQSYKVRIECLIHPQTVPNALKGLQEIINYIDLDNIGRLKNTEDSFSVAMGVMDLVAKYIDIEEAANPPQPKSQNPDPGQGSPSADQSGDDDFEDADDADFDRTPSNGGSSGDDAESDRGADDASSDEDDGSTADGSDTKSGTPGSQSGNGSDPKDDAPEMTSGQLSRAIKALKEMESLIDGNVKKKQASKATANTANSMAGSTEYDIDEVSFEGKKVPVVKIYLSPRLIKTAVNESPILGIVFDSTIHEEYLKTGKHYSIARSNSWSGGMVKTMQGVIQSGIDLGTQLGRKLQIRDQVRDTKYTRLKSGKIDGRVLYQAGYDAQNIFSNTMLDKFIPNVVDISVDASSSMSGSKWIRTQTAVLAIAKACSMIQNVRVKLSYRYEARLGQSGSHEDLVMLDVYDSKRDSIQHLINCIFALQPRNCTPDSLITRYQLNKKLVTPSNPELNSYFINFSDGEPGSSVNGVQYHGESAHRHILKCRKDMEALGVKVMSYFITEKTGASLDRTVTQFKTDWGTQNAKSVNITEVLELAKTLNSLFLSK